MLRALLAATALLLATAASGAGLSPRQARSFEMICAQCHLQPGIGVPLLGDDAAWAPRRARGLEAMVRSSVEGVGGMPPLGTCGYCSEADFRALAAWLSGMAAPGEAAR